MNPLRHPAPEGELRLEWPGQCWVWSCSDAVKWSTRFYVRYWTAPEEDVTASIAYPVSWHAVRTRGPNPPWPTFIDQRDPGDETTDDDGFITVHVSGPSEGYTAEGSRT